MSPSSSKAPGNERLEAFPDFEGPLSWLYGELLVIAQDSRTGSYSMSRALSTLAGLPTKGIARLGIGGPPDLNFCGLIPSSTDSFETISLPTPNGSSPRLVLQRWNIISEEVDIGTALCFLPIPSELVPVEISTVLARCIGPFISNGRAKDIRWSLSLATESNANIDPGGFEYLLHCLFGLMTIDAPPESSLHVKSYEDLEMVRITISREPPTSESASSKPIVALGSEPLIGGILREMIRLSNGTLRLEVSDAGKIECFLELRRARRDKRTQGGRSISAHRHPLGILIVEDSQIMALATSEVLRSLGHSVRLARDGNSALIAVQMDFPDIVLLDVGLPDISGFDVMTELARRYPQNSMTIVGISGYASDVERKKMIDGGFKIVLSKPVDPYLIAILIEGIGTSVANP